MKKVTVTQASRSLGQYATELKDEIVVVTKGNRALAALIPLSNVGREALALSSQPAFLKLIKRARAEIAAGKSISLTDMRERLLPKDPTKKRKRVVGPKRR